MILHAFWTMFATLNPHKIAASKAHTVVTGGRLDAAHHINTSDFGVRRIHDAHLTEIGGFHVTSYRVCLSPI